MGETTPIPLSGFDPAGTYALVRGTVYQRIRSYRHVGDYEWRRMSVPPNARPGRRAQGGARVRFADYELPEHEVITAEQAATVARESLDRWMRLLREAASRG